MNPFIQYRACIEYSKNLNEAIIKAFEEKAEQIIKCKSISDEKTKPLNKKALTVRAKLAKEALMNFSS